MSGYESLAALIDDPGPCPVCDEYECTHAFYGDEHYRIGDSAQRRKLHLAKAARARLDVVPDPPKRSTKGRRARRPSEDRAHHPADDRSAGATPAGEGPPCSSPPPTTET